MKKYLPIISLLLLTYNLSYAGKANSILKVCIKKNVSQVVLSSNRGLVLHAYKKRVITYPKNMKLKFELIGNKFTVNSIVKPLPVKIRSKDGIIFLDKYGYRGDLFIYKSKGRLLVVNSINIEDYLKGVLNSEVSPSWPIEALKTQAVIARTYALYQKKKRINELYHLESSVLGQVYKGSNNETSNSTKAVNKTKGVVVTYNGQLALTVYHSVCGGHTESAENVWAGRGAPYLSGVKCNFDKDAPRYTWKAKIGLKKMEKKLNSIGYKIHDIEDIKTMISTNSGRVFRLKILHSKGQEVISGVDFRKISGYSLIRSTFFNVKIKDGTAFFNGKGSGHGSGLCQWGAKGMAERGYSFKKIISHYYPKTELMSYSRIK